MKALDVHPSAVRENKRLHPGAQIERSSYHRISSIPNMSGSLEVATGLSSLDANKFVPQAIQSIGRALKPGGILLHVQDVRPGNGAGLRAMKKANAKHPYQGEALVGGPSSPILTYTQNGEPVSVGELLRRELGEAIEADPTLELLSNEWVTAKRQLPSGPGKLYYMNICLGTNVPFEEASAVVTVARKRS